MVAPLSQECGLCGAFEHVHGGVLGRMVGPIQLSSHASCYVHRMCALWAPEVYQSDQGTLKHVGEAVRRGRTIRCTHCGRRGATVGCRIEKCTCSYHVWCAMQASCLFNVSRFVLACPEHAHAFAHERQQHPHQHSQHPPTSRHQPLHQPPMPATAGPGQVLQPPTDPRSKHGDGIAKGSRVRRAPSHDRQSPKRKRPRIDTAAVAAHVAAARAALLTLKHQDLLGGPAHAGGPAPPGTAGTAGWSGAMGGGIAGVGPTGGSYGMVSTGALGAAVGGGMAGGAGMMGSLGAAGGIPDVDEAEWRVKEARRLAKDTARLAPIILAGSGGRAQAEAIAARTGGTASGKDPGVRSKGSGPRVWVGDEVPGFEALGGLPHVITCLREVALLPLMHPHLLRRMGVKAPRGILLYGAPGSGKTSAVRALAAECARSAPRPVCLFVRKGADCLGKYVGDAERTLRLLFTEATLRAPSIIFLDELDALAPARSTRESTSDQVHASVVSTLLSLMDGMSDRGQVLVIAATNRPDTLDPALRRPGRFDREIAFDLPCQEARQDILTRLTRGWDPPPSTALLQRLAQRTRGCAGADLQALCCGAVLAAARRVAPNDLLSRPTQLEPPGSTDTDGSAGSAGAVPASLPRPMDFSRAIDHLEPMDFHAGTGSPAADNAEPDGNGAPAIKAEAAVANSGGAPCAAGTGAVSPAAAGAVTPAPSPAADAASGSAAAGPASGSPPNAVNCSDAGAGGSAAAAHTPATKAAATVSPSRAVSSVGHTPHPRQRSGGFLSAFFRELRGWAGDVPRAISRQAPQPSEPLPTPVQASGQQCTLSSQHLPADGPQPLLPVAHAPGAVQEQQQAQQQSLPEAAQSNACLHQLGNQGHMQQPSLEHSQHQQQQQQQQQSQEEVQGGNALGLQQQGNTHQGSQQQQNGMLLCDSDDEHMAGGSDGRHTQYQQAAQTAECILNAATTAQPRVVAPPTAGQGIGAAAAGTEAADMAPAALNDGLDLPHTVAGGLGDAQCAGVRVVSEWVGGVCVEAQDWWAALAAAPVPASAREPAAMMNHQEGCVLPYESAPLLLPTLTHVLSRIANSHMAHVLPQQLATCVIENSTGSSGTLRLEAALQELGIVATATELPQETSPSSGHDLADGDPEGGTQEAAQTGVAAEPESTVQTPVPGPGQGLGLRLPALWLLVCGGAAGDMAMVAGAGAAVMQRAQVVHCGLPRLVLLGGGDPLIGISAALGQARQVEAGAGGAAAHSPLVLLMPGLEAWAVEGLTHVASGDHSSNTESAARVTCEVTPTWNVFKQAMTEVTASRQVLVLATSTLPSGLLPSQLLSSFHTHMDPGQSGSTPSPAARPLCSTPGVVSWVSGSAEDRCEAERRMGAAAAVRTQLQAALEGTLRDVATSHDTGADASNGGREGVVAGTNAPDGRKAGGGVGGVMARVRTPRGGGAWRRNARDRPDAAQRQQEQAFTQGTARWLLVHPSLALVQRHMAWAARDDPAALPYQQAVCGSADTLFTLLQSAALGHLSRWLELVEPLQEALAALRAHALCAAAATGRRQWAWQEQAQGGGRLNRPALLAASTAAVQDLVEGAVLASQQQVELK